MKKAIGGTAVLLAGVLIACCSVFAALFTTDDPPPAPPAATAAAAAFTGQPGVICAVNASATTVAGFSGDQLDNAAIIVAVGKQLKIPQRGWVIAVATSMQEATLHNITFGDIMSNGQMSSSRGLFQQLKTYGPTRTDPAAAAKMFYLGGPQGQPGLTTVPGWQQMSLAQAAESVQQSGLPDAYAKWESPASQVVGKVEGRTCTGGAGGVQPVVLAGNPQASTVINRALAEVGVPYAWGGGDAAGPTLGICGPNGAENDCHITGFDCSGLVEYAYAGIGVAVPHQTLEIWNAFGHITDRSKLLPGDLLLVSSDGTAAGIHHVAMFLGGDRVVEAPYSGVLVRTVDNFWESGNGAHFIGAVRPGATRTV